MKFTINSSCVKCGACAMECPMETIRRGENQYIIGEDCIGCGDCYAICPVGAVQMVSTDSEKE